jgi:prefoldin alpha subunit
MMEEGERQLDIEERARMLDARLRSLRENTERMAQLIMEFEAAKAGIGEIKGGNKDAIINAGGGILIKARLETERVVAPMGAGFYASVTPEDALDKIGKLIESARKNQEAVNGEVKVIEKELVGLLREARGPHQHA